MQIRLWRHRRNSVPKQAKQALFVTKLHIQPIYKLPHSNRPTGTRLLDKSDFDGAEIFPICKLGYDVIGGIQFPNKPNKQFVKKLRNSQLLDNVFRIRQLLLLQNELRSPFAWLIPLTSQGLKVNLRMTRRRVPQTER